MAQAQNPTKKYGEDSIACLINLSQYQEVFKQNNFKEAYPYWKWAVDNCPMSSKFIFHNGSAILEYMIANEKDSSKKEAYIQELFDLFYLRIKYYPVDEGYSLGKIGVYTMKYRPLNYKKALEHMEKSIELDGKESSPQVLDIFIQTMDIYIQKEKLPTDVMIDAYDKVTEILDEMIDANELKMEGIMREIYDNQEKLDSGRITIDDYLAAYKSRQNDSAKVEKELVQLRNVGNNMNIRFAKYATCDILMSIYAKKFETNKDLRTLRQIVKFFAKENCTNNDLFIAAVEELYKQTPNAAMAFYMGNINYQKGEYNDALSYLNQALERFEKEEDKIKTYLLMAECYRLVNQYAAARETAYKILKLNPKDGRAYIFVGNLYMATVTTCTTEVPGAVYWAAADKFAKAKAIDPKRAEEAQKLINTATARFPKTETYFNYGLSKGQTYKIDCWIGESTIIR